MLEKTVSNLEQAALRLQRADKFEESRALMRLANAMREIPPELAGDIVEWLADELDRVRSEP